MNKKAIFTMVLAGFLGLAQAQNNSTSLEHIKSVTAVSKVLGDGRKVSTVILEYDTPISNKSLSAGSYAVVGKEVTDVYANNVPEKTEKGTDGKYVVIEVKAEVDLYAQPKQPTNADLERKRARPDAGWPWTEGRMEHRRRRRIPRQCCRGADKGY